MAPDPYEIALLVVGVAALLAAWVPSYTANRPMSLPLVIVSVGALVFLVPFGLPDFDVTAHLDLTERLTEIGVLVALMGAGLKIDRPFSWSGWSSTIRMIAVGMPLSILAASLLGWWAMGLGAAGALLLGSALAPTDPVLASDVQVGEPEVGDDADLATEDDVRFTLTSEAGLNDALAFPFIYGAIRWTDSGVSVGQLGEWIAVDVVYRLGAGLLVGMAIGWLIGRISFAAPGELRGLAETSQGFVAIAAMLMAYAAAELLGGYGFLAVFVAAVVIRSSERKHEFHGHLSDFVEQSENLLVVGLLVLLGGAVVGGVLGDLTWQAALVALALVLIVRPAVGLISLAGSQVAPVERLAIAVFGIRGFGSVYYVAYAMNGHDFDDSQLIWSTTVAVILVSIVLHGLTATPVMTRVDRARSRWSRVRHRPASA